MIVATYCDGSSSKDLRPCQGLSSSQSNKQTTPSSSPTPKKIWYPPHHSAATHSDRSPAMPPPKPVQQTCDYISDRCLLPLLSRSHRYQHLPRLSLTILLPTIFILQIQHVIAPYSLLPPFSVEQAFLMLPPINCQYYCSDNVCTNCREYIDPSTTKLFFTWYSNFEW